MAPTTLGEVAKLLDTYKVSDALSKILDLAKRCNKYIDETMPWALAKDEEKKERLGTVLYNLLDSSDLHQILLKKYYRSHMQKKCLLLI